MYIILHLFSKFVFYENLVLPDKCKHKQFIHSEYDIIPEIYH